MPKVSVIVPVYQVEPYLHRCVDSVLHQSFADWELILIDDGSPDHCGAICDEYAKQDSRVHVIHQPNSGVSVARNVGLEWTFANSDSQWIAFIDSDDWIHRDYLKLLVTAAEKKDTPMAVCDCLWTDRFLEDAPCPEETGIAMDSETALVKHYPKTTPPWGKIYRKYLLENVRFPQNRRSEDAFVTHIPLFLAKRVTVLPDKLYYYYNNPSSFTRTKWSNRMLDTVDAHEQRLAFFRDGGYERASLRQKEIYVDELAGLIRHLLDSQENDQEDTLCYLQEKLRGALSSARKEGLVPFNRENLWAYLYAMKTDVVWKAVRKLRKLYQNVKK